MTVTEKIQAVNDELFKYASQRNKDTCQRLVVEEGVIRVEDRIILYGDFQAVSPKTRGGRMYPKDAVYWNCLDDAKIMGENLSTSKCRGDRAPSR